MFNHNSHTPEQRNNIYRHSMRTNHNTKGGKNKNMKNDENKSDFKKGIQ